MKSRPNSQCRRPSPAAEYQPLVPMPPLTGEEYVGLRESIQRVGIQVPILVDRKKRIIDGLHRWKISKELGIECPESVIDEMMPEDQLRALARALNLARRQLTPDQRREIIAQQLKETPNRSNRWVAQHLGVSHPAVQRVRLAMASGGTAFQLETVVGRDGKVYPVKKGVRPVIRRGDPGGVKASLMAGDCQERLKEIPTASIDAIITDPPYPEVASRGADYPRISEKEWFDLMMMVGREMKRILKPAGSAMIVIQPNYSRIGSMRKWSWRFVSWLQEEWNLIQDVYWWDYNALPLAGTRRDQGLLRKSVKWCLWLGSPTCWRNQTNVLFSPSKAVIAKATFQRLDDVTRSFPSGRTLQYGSMYRSALEKDGVTPFNLLPIPTRDNPHGHPAVTPYELVAWWCRYILPEGGTLLDPFCGSGTSLLAGIENGASQVIGIEKVRRFLKMAQEHLKSSSRSVEVVMERAKPGRKRARALAGV